MCHLCKSNEIGSELHVFMVCNNPEIMEYRTQLLKIIYKQSPQLEKLQKKTNLATFYRAQREMSFAIFVGKAYKLIVKYKTIKNKPPV